MKIDCVFSGGGVKGYAFLGALRSMEEKQLQLERVAGTSAGAIIASFIAASYRTDEINVLLSELDLQQFLDAPQLTKILPFSKWLFLYYQMGLYKGNKFEKWLYTKLAQKGIYTFGDLKEGNLKVRSEEHTSELQSRGHLVCRLLLEKKKNYINKIKT